MAAWRRVRDVTFAVDACQVRAGNTPRVMVALRKATTSLLRLADLAAALRGNAADDRRVVKLPDL